MSDDASEPSRWEAPFRPESPTFYAAGDVTKAQAIDWFVRSGLNNGPWNTFDDPPLPHLEDTERLERLRAELSTAAKAASVSTDPTERRDEWNRTIDQCIANSGFAPETCGNLWRVCEVIASIDENKYTALSYKLLGQMAGSYQARRPGTRSQAPGFTAGGPGSISDEDVFVYASAQHNTLGNLSDRWKKICDAATHTRDETKHNPWSGSPPRNYPSAKESFARNESWLTGTCGSLLALVADIRRTSHDTKKPLSDLFRRGYCVVDGGDMSRRTTVDVETTDNVKHILHSRDNNYRTDRVDTCLRSLEKHFELRTEEQDNDADTVVTVV